MILAKSLVAGNAKGPPLELTTPLSFWGGLDVATGQVMDRHHPDFGKRLSGTILMMEQGRGSSSGASVLAEAIRIGTAPVAVLLRKRDAIIVTGAMVAAELYGRNCPVVLIESAADWRRIAACTWLHLSCREGEATIDFSGPGGAPKANRGG
jgi:predicted aconitase with swiveling domain